MKGNYCLECNSKSCWHLSERHTLTPREMSIVRVLFDPRVGPQGKHIAFALGISHGTLKVYLSRMYRKMGWTGKGDGCQRRLFLWSVAHREELGITLPTAEMFEGRPAA